jgi:hypothetical protein
METHLKAMQDPFMDPMDGSDWHVIVDLSFPSANGHAVNMWVPLYSYVGRPFATAIFYQKLILYAKGIPTTI